MDKNFIIDLTNRLYRLTLLFPKKEPLRYKLRETADDVLANFVVWQTFSSSNPGSYVNQLETRQKDVIFTLEKDLEVLNSFFEVAKWQNWINYFDVLEIQEEYGKIKENLIGEIQKIEDKDKLGLEQVRLKIPESVVGPGLGESTKKIKVNGPRKEIESRKRKILEILREVGRIQVGEINKLLPEVSKRTIRRDFQKLVEQGIIERIGEQNNTFYKIKSERT